MTDNEYQATDRVRRWRQSGGWRLTLIWLCGHNPQCLLTDQRSDEEKFRATFLDGIASMFGDPCDPSKLIPHSYPGSKLHIGGTITGRWPSRQPLMHNLPRGEKVVLHHDLLDYGQVESRMLRPTRYRKD